MDNELNRSKAIAAASRILKDLEDLDTLVRDNNYQNEQWFINFQDKINEISIR